MHSFWRAFVRRRRCWQRNECDGLRSAGVLIERAIVIYLHAALMGFFRNRGPDVMPEVPDREGRVTRAVADGKCGGR